MVVPYGTWPKYYQRLLNCSNLTVDQTIDLVAFAVMNNFPVRDVASFAARVSGSDQTSSIIAMAGYLDTLTRQAKSNISQ